MSDTVWINELHYDTLDNSGRLAVRPVSQLSSGDVDQDSAVLLAKLNAAGSVTFQVSTDAAFGTLLVNQVVAVADPLVPAKLQLTNGTLTAGTTYHWRALGADGEVETARVRTPDAVTVQGLCDPCQPGPAVIIRQRDPPTHLGNI